MTKSQQLKTINEICPEEGLVILQPVAMRIPNSHCVYSPSKLRSKKEISQEEFQTQYANYPQKIRVCFDESPSSATILQRSKVVTAYSLGLDCWYIMVSPDIGNALPEKYKHSHNIV